MSHTTGPFLSCAPPPSDDCFARAPQHLVAACERRDPRAAQALWRYAVTTERFDLAAIAAGAVVHVDALVALVSHAWTTRSVRCLAALTDVLGVELELDGLDRLDGQLRQANGRLVHAQANREHIVCAMVECLVSGWGHGTWISQPRHRGGPAVACRAHFERTHAEPSMRMRVWATRVEAGRERGAAPDARSSGPVFRVDRRRMAPGIRAAYEAPNTTALTRCLAHPRPAFWPDLGSLLDLISADEPHEPELAARVTRALDEHWPRHYRRFPTERAHSAASARLLASLASTLDTTGELDPRRLGQLATGELPSDLDTLIVGPLSEPDALAMDVVLDAGRLDGVIDLTLEAGAPASLVRRLAARVGPNLESMYLTMPVTFAAEDLAAWRALVDSASNLRRLCLSGPAPFSGSSALVPNLLPRMADLEWLQLHGMGFPRAGDLSRLLGELGPGCQFLSITFSGSDDDPVRALLESPARASLEVLQIHSHRRSRNARRLPPTDACSSLPSLRALSLHDAPSATLVAAALDAPVTEVSLRGLEADGATLATWLRGAWRDSLERLDLDDDAALVDGLFDDASWPRLSELSVAGCAVEVLRDTSPDVLPALVRVIARGATGATIEALLDSALAPGLDVLCLDQPADTKGVIRAMRRSDRLDARVDGLAAVQRVGAWRKLDFDTVIERFAGTLLRPPTH